MDLLTHALASYSLKRVACPRLPRSATIAMIIAGTIADIDSLSKFAGPSAFLTFYRTYCHSLLAALFFSLLLTLPFFVRKREPTGSQTSPALIFLAALAASVLHLLMDVCQSSGLGRPSRSLDLGNSSCRNSSPRPQQAGHRRNWGQVKRPARQSGGVRRSCRHDSICRLALRSPRQRLSCHGIAHLPRRIAAQSRRVC